MVNKYFPSEMSFDHTYLAVYWTLYLLLETLYIISNRLLS